MTFLRSLFLNFLAVFFVNRMIPGIEVNEFQQVPNFGADVLFSFVVGLLNALVFPFLFTLELTPTRMKIAVITFVISFAAFLFIAIVPYGVRANAGGVIFGGLIVWGMAFFTNYLEWHQEKIRKP